MKHPTFDLDGYPTEETLHTITFWGINNIEDVRSLIQYVEEAWNDIGSIRREIVEDDEAIVLCTGGWYGNERIIQALEDNDVFKYRCWHSSYRGGRFIYLIV